MEKFRFRLDKMIARETFLMEDKVVERFVNGRKDRLKEREFYKMGATIVGGEPEDVSRYYSASRLDGLTKRVQKDMELIEEYTGRPDHLIHMYVHFIPGEKKFGPAEQRKQSRDIGKIIETYEVHTEKDDLAAEDPDDKQSISPGRILDTDKGIMERTFDIEGHRILLKFHREKGQIFCKTVEFFEPREKAMVSTAVTQTHGSQTRSTHSEHSSSAANQMEAQPVLTPEDVKVYLVDPRDEKPCLRELSDIYKEQCKKQEEAIKRVSLIEHEMDGLLEKRMKELSANDMEVWVFDTKRNPQVLKGRLEQEQLARRKEESMMDLELDFLAPYLQRIPDISSMTKAQALEVRDECLNDIRMGLDDKERFLQQQIDSINEEIKLKKGIMPHDELKSKKFMCNVLLTRLARQKRESLRVFNQAEKKVKSDVRLVNILDKVG